MSDSPPAGWFPDPEEPNQVRFWDGTAWTDQRAAGPSAAAPVDDAAQQPITVAPLLSAGALLVVAGLARVVSYLAPYEAFGVALIFSALEVLAWIGAFVCFLVAGYPSRRRHARVLTLVLVGLYAVSGMISLGIALNPYGAGGLLALAGLFGFAVLGVGIAFAISAIRTPTLTRRIAVLPLALYLGLIAVGFVAGVASAAAATIGGAAATAGILLAAASGLAPAAVGALFLAFGRRPHVSVD
jgi:hypothetical protein